MILIDSDVAVDILRGYPPAIDWFDSLTGTENLIVSGYTAVELLAGTSNLTEQRKVQRWLDRFGVAWLSQSGCADALRLFGTFHLRHNAGLFDVFIGQTALEYDIPLQTFNMKLYRFIPRIRLEQPYQR